METTIHMETTISMVVVEDAATNKMATMVAPLVVPTRETLAMAILLLLLELASGLPPRMVSPTPG